MFLYLWILVAFAVAQQPCVEHLNRTPRLLGSYRPQCTKQGFYHPKQCHGSTGYCWCVTPIGERRLAPVGPGQTLHCET